MKIFKRTIFIIITILLVILLLINAYSFVSINVLGKRFATINGYTLLEVVSGSMEPEIHIGDMVLIDTKVKDYQEGDIVTFYDAADSLVTHQIIEMSEDSIITKGTNNNTQDDPITIDKIVGKYVFKIGGAGKLIEAFKHPMSMVMILIVGVLMCVFTSMDKDGNPILNEEEKELEEFRNYKKSLELKEEKVKTNSKTTKKTSSKNSKEVKTSSKKPKANEEVKKVTKSTSNKKNSKSTKSPSVKKKSASTNTNKNIKKKPNTKNKTQKK